MTHHRWRRGNEHLYLAGEHVLDRLAGALVRHVDHLRTGLLLEQRGAYVRKRTVALRSVVHLAGMGFEVGDEFLQVVRRHRRMHGDHVGCCGNEGDRREVALSPRQLGNMAGLPTW